MYPQNIGEWITGRREYNQTPEQKEEVIRKLEGMDALEKLLILVDYSAAEHEIVSWDGKYYESAGSVLEGYHSILKEQWGFRIDDENIIKMLDGTHENYLKKSESWF